ncbi:hypothetical protein Ccrd_014055 [Cynara cardunculus var. scolymus]|uniref:Luc7-like protein 3 n=1 Tax=Cynara cardunculus var. scolymus TaxID=59895 RepID=A0A124SGV3_CYNCS|nr:hypothetical protein Ccrd_014055 [Cynara cardunculus var. scolymus]
MDAQRALLDELMGSARNLTEEERRGHKEITWDDKEVCGFYMVKFCPHDLFVNTRSDLGPCPKIHDPKLKESFESSPRHDSYVPKFEAELAHFCEKLASLLLKFWRMLVAYLYQLEIRRFIMLHICTITLFQVMDLDRRVKRGRERLAQEVEVPPPPPVPVEKSEQLSVLEEKIKNLLESVEALGEAGKVDEAEALMRKVDLLNMEKTALTLQPQSDKVLMLAQEKKMALCETCGSFLIANDALERTQSHEAKEKAREEERLAREKEAEERRKQREKEVEGRRRSGSADRDKNRHRECDRRDRERSRDRNSRGSRDMGRASERRHNSFRNGGDRSRDRYRERDRSRSHSPARHGGRRRKVDLCDDHPFVDSLALLLIGALEVGIWSCTATVNIKQSVGLIDIKP